MNFPKFWALGNCRGYASWRSSNISQEDAQGQADASAVRVAQAIESGNAGNLGHSYYGTDRPQREEVLREFKGDSGEIDAAITRNAYGCLVLNTARIMFIDVDAEEPRNPAGGGSLFGWLFGPKKPWPMKEKPSRLQEQLVARAAKVVEQNLGWGWRIYQTRAGFRLLATHALFDPAEIATAPLFEELGADPLYRRLCKAQKCYRARLTPKPWRCKAGKPPATWPWISRGAEERFKQWEARYLAASGNFSTCQLITSLGNPEIHPAIQPILDVHDKMTRVDSQLPLA